MISASKSALTAQDIAGMLGFSDLSSFQSALLRFKWAREEDCHSEIIASLYESIPNIQEAMGWSKYRPNLIWELCELAIKEYCIFPTCRSCLGQKFKKEVIDDIPTGKIIPCQSCFGSGVKSGRREGQLWKLGLSPRDWRRYGWSRLYKTLLEKLDFEESKAFKCLRFAAE